MSGLKLDLPPAPQGGRGSGRLWQGAVIALLVAILAGVWWPRERPAPAGQAPAAPAAAPAEAYDEDLVVKLKNAGAYAEAAALLDPLLRRTDLPPGRRAGLLRTQAGLHAAGGEHGKAVACLYRAGKLLAGLAGEEELAKAVDRDLIEALRKAGRYDAVSGLVAERDRQARGERKAGPEDPVVARVDGEPLRKSDLEVVIQARVEERAAELTADLDDPERKARVTEDLRKQYAAPAEQLRLLKEHVAAEIMTREAAQWKLDQHPEYRRVMESVRRSLLQSLLIKTRVEGEPVSETDLANFIEANRAELGLSTEPGKLSPRDLAKARPAAEKRYRQEKSRERAAAFQEELMKRHKVEIEAGAFSEGAR